MVGKKFGEFTLFEHLAKWRMNRSAKRLVIVRTNLDGFSLANHQHLTKLSPCQTFLLYGILSISYYTLYYFQLTQMKQSVVASSAKLHIPTGASLERLRRDASHVFISILYFTFKYCILKCLLQDMLSILLFLINVIYVVCVFIVAIPSCQLYFINITCTPP